MLILYCLGCGWGETALINMIQIDIDPIDSNQPWAALCLAKGHLI